MLMMFWFYRVQFAIFAYFVSSVVFFVLSLFMLRRGVYMRRPGLRQTAFVLMFLSLLKLFMVDVRLAKKFLLCESDLSAMWHLPCSPAALMAMDFIGLGLFLLSCFLILKVYVAYRQDRDVAPKTPDKVHLRLWANLSMWGVILMLCWLAAPWLGYLTVGHVPRIFVIIPWPCFAVMNLTLLLVSFWKSESCSWIYKLEDKAHMQYLTNSWTPKDTLWLTVFLYLIALAFSYVSHDVLRDASI